MGKMHSITRRAGVILASALVLFSAVSFTGCSNSSDDDVNNMLISIINSRFSRIRGEWKTTTTAGLVEITTGYELTATEFKNYTKVGDTKTTQWEAGSIEVDFKDNNSGYISFKVTKQYDSATNELKDSGSMVGKYLVVHFKELSDDGKSVKLAFASKAGATEMFDTLAGAKKEYTVDNGYFADVNYSTYSK